MAIESISHTFFFVFFAYTAAFAPWSILSGKDYISSTWKSVKATRQSGYFHLIFSSLPAMYVAVYAVVKYLAGDFEESCAALVAFFFALWHMLRTAWGLWQLEEFRKWAEESVRSLNEMGIKYELFDQPSTDAAKIANEMLVNDTMIDNQITHGRAQCYLRYGDAEVLKPWNDKDFIHWKELLNGKWIYERIVQWVRLIGMICVDTVRHAVGLKKQKSRKLTMVPVRPVKLWVSWALAFAGQGMREWMRDFSMPRDPDAEGLSADMSAADKMKKRGEHFGSEVLVSAALQLWNEIEGREGKLGPFLLKGWDTKGNMGDGRVVKDELLELAMSSGDALPFGARQMESVRSTNSSSGWQGPSYDKYREAISNGISEVPPEEVYLDEVRKFSVEMLEWLTIMLHLGVMSRKVHKAGGQSSSLGDVCNSGLRNEEKEGRNKKKNEKAVLNLCAQLSIGESAVGPSKKQADGESWIGRRMRAVGAFPGLSEVVGWTSKEGNRHVTMVGEMVDVWMALVAGEQLSFLVEKLNREWEKLCLGPGEKEEESVNLSAVREANAAVERRRLETRVADSSHRYRYRDQFVTFMGYRMEAVRSTIGHWVSRNQGRNADELFDMATSSSSATSIYEKLSGALCLLLSACPGVLVWKRRGVQCRLIWELQNVLERRVRKAERKTSENESENEICVDNRERSAWVGVEIAMLMVLSFPSIAVSVTEVDEQNEIECEKCCSSSTHVDVHALTVKRSRDSASVAHSTVRIQMRAVCGPQNLSVIADIGSCGMCRLRLEGRNVVFKWRLWRDAFHGRLEGLWEWQKEHGIGGVEVKKIGEGNSNGAESEVKEMRSAVGKILRTWNEWQPFRVSFCRFEMETEGFLEQVRVSGHVKRAVTTMGNVTTDLPELPVHTIEAVEYEDADEDVLAHSCVLVEEVVQRVDTGSDYNDVSKEERNAADVLKDMAERRLKSGEHRQALLMYEMAAMHYGDADAVVKSIDIVTEARGLVAMNERRGADILSAFVGKMVSEGPRKSLLSENQAKVMRDTVLPQCERLLTLWGDREDVCMSITDLIETFLAGGYREDYTRGLLSGQRMLFLSTSLREPIAVLHHIASVIEFVEANARSEDVTRASSAEQKGRLEKWNMENQLVLWRILENGTLMAANSDSGAVRSEAICTRKYGVKGINLEHLKHATQWSNDETSRFDCVNWLGLLMQRGMEGIDADPHRAMRLYERAIKEGNHVRAMYNLANLLKEGAEGIDADPHRAMRLYERAIKEGNHVMAMTNLGWLLHEGAEGIDADPHRAMRLYERAIKEGIHVSAMYNLALLLQKGAEGIDADPHRAMRLYERAIKEGNDVMAMNNLALLLEHGAEGIDADPHRAMRLYERATKEGNDVSAMYNLALLLQKGAEGIDADPHRAMRLYERAIKESNDVMAMNNLALLLEHGAEGIDADPRRAMRLYERAIKEGNDVMAMNNLGWLLQHGAEGIEADARRAADLYEQAIAEGNHQLAMNNLAALLEEGAEGVNADPERAEQLREQAKGAE